MRRPHAIAFAAVLLAAPAAAQELDIPPARIPTLPATALNLDGLIPAGWKMETKALGDLNGDGVTDVAMVVRGNDRALVLANEGLGANRLDTNPRMLVVGFGRKGGGYRIVVQNATLIPRHVDPVVDDPFDSVTGGGLSIHGRSLRVQLGFFMSAGGWGMFNVTHTFRWQNDRLELIGYDRNDTQRNTGETRSVSINYSTGKVKIATGNIEDDDQTVTWKTLPDRRRLSIDEVGDGLEFDSGFND